MCAHLHWCFQIREVLTRAGIPIQYARQGVIRSYDVQVQQWGRARIESLRYRSLTRDGSTPGTSQHVLDLMAFVACPGTANMQEVMYAVMPPKTPMSDSLKQVMALLQECQLVQTASLPKPKSLLQDLSLGRDVKPRVYGMVMIDACYNLLHYMNAKVTSLTFKTHRAGAPSWGATGGGGAAVGAAQGQTTVNLGSITARDKKILVTIVNTVRVTAAATVTTPCCRRAKEVAHTTCTDQITTLRERVKVLSLHDLLDAIVNAVHGGQKAQFWLIKGALAHEATEFIKARANDEKDASGTLTPHVAYW